MSRINAIKSWLKVGNQIWCEGKMQNIYDIAKDKQLTEDKALAWAVCYWLDHN